MNADLSKTLLTHHRKLSKWLQFGGHSDGDENTMTVATRKLGKNQAYKNSSLQKTELPILMFTKYLKTKRKLSRCAQAQYLLFWWVMLIRFFSKNYSNHNYVECLLGVGLLLASRFVNMCNNEHWHAPNIGVCSAQIKIGDTEYQKNNARKKHYGKERRNHSKKH